MKKIETTIKDLFILEPQVFGDDRGFFFESFNEDKFASMGIAFHAKQGNYSCSQKGVLRGLHFQHPPKAVAKLVMCPRGRLWDCAVDLRKDSETYLQWFGVELSDENKRMLYVPAGFGHGFYALEDCDLAYLLDGTYDADYDANVKWNDPAFDIEWPLDGEPTLSSRDQAAPGFDEAIIKF